MVATISATAEVLDNQKIQTLPSPYLCCLGTVMKVIPVIDILNGIAVHGIRGERKKYQPIKSVLTKSAEPVEVAAAFEEPMGYFGISVLYKLF